MRRLLIALVALTITATASFTQFQELQRAKFETLVRSNAPVVVHTHEWWCTTCRSQANVLESLKKDPKFSRVTMLRASTSGNRDVLEPMKVTSRSIIVVFAGGKEIGRLSWITDEAQIRALLEKAVAQAG